MKRDNGKGLAYYQNLRAKYLNLAKEAASSGDRVLSEYNLQFAEHYGRVMNSKFRQRAPNDPKQPQFSGNDSPPEVGLSKTVVETVREIV
jgi:hypothetical protein